MSGKTNDIVVEVAEPARGCSTGFRLATKRDTLSER